MFTKICCPHCRGSLTISFSSQDAKVFFCKCFKYPFIKGILYLKRNAPAKRAVRLIEQKRYGKAVRELIHARLLLYLPVKIFLLGKAGISFKFLLNILQIFGFDRAWTGYLHGRNESPYFKLAIFSARSLGRKDAVLDFGCGVGQIFPYITSKCDARHVYGIDSSFLNLLISRRYFANPGVKLICADGEEGIPFKKLTLDKIIATDSFHYLKNKRIFLKGASDSLKRSGRLDIIHTIEGSGTLYGNIRAVRSGTLLKMMGKSAFKTVRIFPDSDIAYTVFAAKGKLSKI